MSHAEQQSRPVVNDARDCIAPKVQMGERDCRCYKPVEKKSAMIVSMKVNATTPW